MRETHNTVEASPLTKHDRWSYIPIIERDDNSARDERIKKMATSFFRTAFERVVAARERQASRYVNGVLMNLDDQTLHGMGTSREELRRKGVSTSVF
ncbi:hypothetical protein [Pseudorhizobium tarimense]|nr:hypothetical protein [Pseudorhizobium tarimense]